MMIDVKRQAWAPLVVAILLGGVMAACGGGGGGGTTNGSTNGSTNGGCTGITNPDPTLATINSRVVIDDPAQTVLSNILVNFYNAGGQLVAQGTTDACGNLAVQVPPTATTAQIPTNTINTAAFYATYRNGGESFSSSSTTCRLSLPSLVAGASYTLSAFELILRTSPPPPPPNCQ